MSWFKIIDRMLLLSVSAPLLFMSFFPPGDENWRETDWSAYLAQQEGGIDEYRLPDGSRVDIYDVEDGVAWEVEWDDKWPESIGQALFYSLSLDNQSKSVVPGVWLLKRSNSDEDYLQCLSVIRELRGKGFDIRFRVENL